MNLSHLYQQLQKLPRLFEVADAAVETLRLSVSDLSHAALRLEGLLKPAPPPPAETFVYVLPTNSPMMAQVVRVAQGCTSRVMFEPYVEIPAGSWIVIAGSGHTCGVKVGNQYQSSMSDFQGHVCQLKDPAQVGIRITVELQG